MKEKIEYPSWHDEARKGRANGKSLAQLADQYGVGASRMSQIATPNWKSYLVAFRGERQTVSNASKDVDKYEFVPMQLPCPRQVEETKKKRPVYPSVSQAMEAEMARGREFQTVKKLHEGKVLVGAKISCSSCDKSDEYYNYKGSVTPEHLPKEFTRMGWAVGKAPRADKCPDCMAKLKAKPSDMNGVKPIQPTTAEPVTEGEIITAKSPLPIPTPPVVKSFGDLPKVIAPQQKKEEPVLHVTPPPAEVPAVLDAVKAHVEAKREAQPIADDAPMTRADRRIVFAKLEEVYVDEREGYRDDWSDAKVAADLGVPVGWIKEVRDDNFGPEITAEGKAKAAAQAAAKTKELNDLIAKNENLIVLLDKKIEIAQELDAKLKTAMTEMNLAIDRAEQLAKNIETEDAKMEDLFKAFDDGVDAFKKIRDEVRRETSD